MKFRRADAYHARSECGRYTIVPYEAPRDGGCWLAWRAQEGRTAARLLGWPRWQAGDAAGREAAYRAAVGLCEQDAREARAA